MLIYMLSHPDIGATDAAGRGGNSESGTAVGGNASSRHRFTPRSQDSDTAGGNAYSGATNNVNGGYIVNDAGRGRLRNGIGCKLPVSESFSLPLTLSPCSQRSRSGWQNHLW